MLHIFKELVKIYGVNPSIDITYKEGRSRFDPNTDTIFLFCNPAEEYAIHVFTLLHEYRHALQVTMKLYPDMLDANLYDMNIRVLGYYNVPWERDANNWAWRKGKEMGFWGPDWKPPHLYGYPVGDLK